MFNSEIHRRNTRQITNFLQPKSNLSLYQKGILNMGIKIYNNLPSFIKRILDNSKDFKSFIPVPSIQRTNISTTTQHLGHYTQTSWL